MNLRNYAIGAGCVGWALVTVGATAAGYVLGDVIGTGIEVSPFEHVRAVAPVVKGVTTLAGFGVGVGGPLALYKNVRDYLSD